MKKSIYLLFAVLAAGAIAAGYYWYNNHNHNHDHAHDHDHDHEHCHGHSHETGHVHSASEAGHEEHDHNEHDHAHNGEKSESDEHDHDDEGLIELTPEQKELIGLKVREAAYGRLEHMLWLDGEIRFNQDKVARLMPKMPGFVVDIRVTEGSRVGENEVLAVLQSQKLGELYADYNAHKELEAYQKIELAMYEKLNKSRSVADIEYLKIKQRFAESRINLDRARQMLAALNLDPENLEHEHDVAPDDPFTICTHYTIQAPFAGTVVFRDLSLGENFPEDNERVVLTVADLSHLWLELQARQTDLPKLKTGMEVVAELGEGFDKYSGKIVYIASQADETSRMVTVRVLLENDGALKPGLFAKGKIALEDGDPTVLIPRHALQIIDGEHVVFVPDSHGHGYEIREVKVGRTGDKQVEILNGLYPGDRFVAEGAFELKAIALTRGMDPHAGHGH